MKSTKKNNSSRTIFAFLIVVICLPALSKPAMAQGASPAQGNTAIYNAAGNCSPSCGFSPAIIDASVFLGNGQGTTLCDTIYGILGSKFNNTYPAGGAVIDARGISGSSALTCASNTSPWLKNGVTLTSPSTILLPPGTIVITTTWTLPPSTKLIGASDNIGIGLGTNIQACAGSTCFTGSAMLQFCSSACSGVSVENLMLNGNSHAINGIVNAYSGELTYVDKVSLYQILGTGLEISAQDSGPYSNINFNTGSASASASTACAQIIGTSLTRGIHGLTCTSNLTPSAAVLLDASNNTIEDASIDDMEIGQKLTTGKSRL